MRRNGNGVQRVITIRVDERCTWLPMLLLFALADGAQAGAIYKCIDGAGAIAYQDRPCAEREQESVFEIEPAPAYAPSPHYAVERTPPGREAKPHARRSDSEPMSFECRATDGQVFYRHGGCPHSVAARGGGAGGTTSKRGKSGGGTVTVRAQRITREEACERIHAAGSIGRAGHEHDEDVSTYDRNLGRDPCG